MSRDDAAVEHSVAGGWLGTYYHHMAGVPPTRFEATFTLTGATGSHFRGVILDDGPLGEARVTGGAQTGRHVRFTKTYVQQSEALGNTFPVRYEGTMSEDGRTLRGEWHLTHRLPWNKKPVIERGTWEARRLWFEQAEPGMRPEEAGHTLSAAAAAFKVTPLPPAPSFACEDRGGEDRFGWEK